MQHINLILIALSYAITVLASPAPLFKSYSGFQTHRIPSTPSTKPSIAQFISSAQGLDAAKLSAINSSAFDWWYFDCLSADLKTSLTVIFFTSLTSAFPFIDDVPATTVVGIYATWPNGTVYTYALDASEATITTLGQGSTGDFVGSGASWKGSSDLKKYVVSINSPQNAIVGSFTLRSVAPARYACGPARSGVQMQVGPHIGWANAVPDANGKVDFMIDGSELKFRGVAYHDKNWSDQPFQDNVASWYWGHGRLGEYSLVWFSFLSLNGSEYTASYFSRGDKILVASCARDAITVRPYGNHSQYPPSVSSGYPLGFTIDADLGRDLGWLNVNITARKILVDADGLYVRSAGSLVGTVGRNGTLLKGGVALFEQFVLVDEEGISVI